MIHYLEVGQAPYYLSTIVCWLAPPKPPIVYYIVYLPSPPPPPPSPSLTDRGGLSSAYGNKVDTHSISGGGGAYHFSRYLSMWLERQSFSWAWVELWSWIYFNSSGSLVIFFHLWSYFCGEARVIRKFRDKKCSRNLVHTPRNFAKVFDQPKCNIPTVLYFTRSSQSRILSALMWKFFCIGTYRYFSRKFWMVFFYRKIYKANFDAKTTKLILLDSLIQYTCLLKCYWYIC
jgi:hypothetical protein